MAVGRMKRRTYPVTKGEQVADWFRANPHDYLSIEDMAAKWGVSVSSAHAYVSSARRHVGLERVSVYRLARPRR